MRQPFGGLAEGQNGRTGGNPAVVGVRRVLGPCRPDGAVDPRDRRGVDRRGGDVHDQLGRGRWFVARGSELAGRHDARQPVAVCGRRRLHRRRRRRLRPDGHDHELDLGPRPHECRDRRSGDGAGDDPGGWVDHQHRHMEADRQLRHVGLRRWRRRAFRELRHVGQSDRHRRPRSSAPTTSVSTTPASCAPASAPWTSSPEHGRGPSSTLQLAGSSTSSSTALVMSGMFDVAGGGTTIMAWRGHPVGSDDARVRARRMEQPDHGLALDRRQHGHQHRHDADHPRAPLSPPGSPTPASSIRRRRG